MKAEEEFAAIRAALNNYKYGGSLLDDLRAECTPEAVEHLLDAAHWRDVYSDALERIKVALRIEGTGSYVDWAEQCRGALTHVKKSVHREFLAIARVKKAEAREEKLIDVLSNLFHHFVVGEFGEEFCECDQRMHKCVCCQTRDILAEHRKRSGYGEV